MVAQTPQVVAEGHGVDGRTVVGVGRSRSARVRVAVGCLVVAVQGLS